MKTENLNNLQPGKIYSLFNKSGVMQELTDTNLKIGQIIWLNGYGQDKYHHDRRAIYEIEPSKFDGRINYKWVNLDQPTKGLENAYLIRPESEIFGIGIYYTPGDFATPEQITEALSLANQKETEDKKLQTARSEYRAQMINKGREIFEANKPAGAVAVIIAEHMIDDSDIQTDYFSSHDDKRVILAFSNHTRDLFSEMRKAAALFEKTAHLGPDKGIFKPFICINEDFYYNGCYYHENQAAPCYRELTENKEFSTREECQQYIDSLGTLKPVDFDGKIVNFHFYIREEEIEHREKYSMGAGYYLGRSKYAGWIVRKEAISEKWNLENLYFETGCGNFFATKSEKTAPAPAALIAGEGFTLVDYSDRAVALFGDTRPIKDTLKEMGGRFNPALTLNGVKTPGWIFQISKRDTLEKLFINK